MRLKNYEKIKDSDFNNKVLQFTSFNFDRISK